MDEKFIEGKDKTILEGKEIKDCDFEIQGIKRSMLDIVANLTAMKHKDKQGSLDTCIKVNTSIIVGFSKGNFEMAKTIHKMIGMMIEKQQPKGDGKNDKRK